MDDTYIRDKILRMNKERNWSFYHLAKKAGISQSTLSNLLTRNNQPQVNTVEKICNAFGITLSEFFADNCKNNIDGYVLQLENVDIYEVIDGNETFIHHWSNIRIKI